MSPTPFICIEIINMKKIFVAGPYNSDDQSTMDYRLNKIIKYCTDLFLKGDASITPLILGLSYAKKASLPTDSNTWRKFSETLLKGCDEIHVLMMNGWEESKGVQFEIEEAKRLNITVKYIDL